MDWKECCDRRIVKDVKPDPDMAKSLLTSSRNKRESESRLEMSDVTAVSKVSLAYDSLRELLEAIALDRGYKIYNHECYTAFFKEIMEKSEMGDEFDDIRKARNAVNYYGKKISTDEASSLLKKIQDLRTLASQVIEK